MEPSSGMRDYVKDRIREIGEADILVGIPCYNEEKTISNVITTASQGLVNHYPELKSVIIVSDGGSLDDTREKAKEAKVDSRVEKIVTIYRGLPGKGTSFRLIFETAEKLKCKACCVFDSDLRSISPDWVRFLISPILDRGFDYVTPWYIRDKYDGTITNNICYPMTRALYGLRIRQPIGGDFGFSGSLASFYAHEEVWQSNVAKFGIDIWMTTTALNEGFKVCQAHMGAKVHEVKDPSTLGIMFVQVVGTLFGLIGKYKDKWRKVKQSRPTELFGEFSQEAPPRVEVSLDKLLREIRLDGNISIPSGWRYFLLRPLRSWRRWWSLRRMVLNSLPPSGPGLFTTSPTLTPSGRIIVISWWI